MDKLARGKKLCKKCQGSNPIRSFVCKSCNNPFGDTINQKTKKPPKEVIISQLVIPIKQIVKNSQIITNLQTFIISQRKLLEKYEQIKDNNIFNLQFSFDLIEGFILKKDFKNSNKYYEDFHEFNIYNDEILTYYLISDRSCNHYYIIIYSFQYNDNNNYNQIPLKIFKINPPLKSDTNSLMIKGIKVVKNSLIFAVIVDEIIQFFMYTKDELINFFNLKSLFIPISILHNYFTFIDFFVSDNIMKIVVSDSSNKIYLYHINTSINNEFDFNNLFTLENIYENFFSFSLTDLAFLDITEGLKTMNNQMVLKQYFCASSKDGFLKIFDSHNPYEPIFKTKISEVWICNFHYENSNQTLFITVNRDSKNKVQSIKFFEDKDKEPKFKRINETENTIYCTYSTYLNRFFYLIEKGEIYSIDEHQLSNLYKRNKSKKPENLTKLEFSMNDHSIKNKIIYNENLLPKNFHILTNIHGKSILIIFNQLYIIYKPIK